MNIDVNTASLILGMTVNLVAIWKIFSDHRKTFEDFKTTIIERIARLETSIGHLSNCPVNTKGQGNGN